MVILIQYYPYYQEGRKKVLKESNGQFDKHGTVNTKVSV